MKKSEKQKTIDRPGPTAAPKPKEETVAQTGPSGFIKSEDLGELPIERVSMPTDDVSDLRDVVDAINRLCETMKTSDYSDNDDSNDVEQRVEVETEVKVESEVELVSPEQIVVSEVETYVAELWSDASSLYADSVDAAADNSVGMDNVSNLVLDSSVINKPDAFVASHQLSKFESEETVPSKINRNREGKQDNVVLDSCESRIENVQAVASNQCETRVESVVSVASESVVFDREQITATFEPISEIYYTASSEVSLLSDVELPDRIQEEMAEGSGISARDDRNGVMAGHVAAMRERFESMTRANTPCPDAMRSVSPSLDVYRNITPSPDHLG